MVGIRLGARHLLANLLPYNLIGKILDRFKILYGEDGWRSWEEVSNADNIISSLSEQLQAAHWEIERLSEENRQMTLTILEMDRIKEEIDNYLKAEGVDKPCGYDLTWRLKTFEDISKAHRKDRLDNN